MVRIAAAELADRDADAELLDLLQASGDELYVLQDGALGDLQREQRGLYAGLKKRTPDVRRESLATELAGGDGNRDAHTVACNVPRGGLGRRLLEHPAADRHAQPGFLGQRDEVLGRKHPLCGVTPAQLRLETRHPAGRQVVDRLVHQEELFVLHRFVELALEHPASLDHRAHVRVEERVAVLPGGLRRLECQMRVAQELLGCRVPAEGDADAGGQEDARAEVSDVDRLVQRLDDAPRERVQPRAARRRLDQHHELVAAETTDGVVCADHGLEPFGDGAQQFVSRPRTQLVVDILEPVDVDEERTGEQSRLAARASEHALGAVHHQRPVGKPRQRVVKVLVGYLAGFHRRCGGVPAPGSNDDDERCEHQAEEDPRDQQDQRMPVG